MKKKVLSICAIILCACFVLVGCGSSSIDKKFYANKYIKMAVASKDFTKTTKLDGINKAPGNYYTDFGLLIVKNAENKFGVYSAMSNSLVIPCVHNNEDYIKFNLCGYENNSYDIIFVKTPETVTPATPAYWTIYNQKGVVLFDDVADTSGDPNCSIESYRFGKTNYEFWDLQDTSGENINKIFKVTGLEATDRAVVYDFEKEKEKGTVLGSDRIPAFAFSDFNPELLNYTLQQVPTETSVTAYNVFKGDKKIGTFSVDTSKFLTISTSPNVSTEPIIIGSNIYWQEFEELDFVTATKYDFIHNASKYNFKTKVFNLKTGKTSTLKINSVLLDRTYTVWDYLDHSAQLKQDYIEAMPIVDKQLQQASTVFFFAKEGKLTEVDYPTVGYYKTNKGYLSQYYSAGSNLIFLTDKKGNVINHFNTTTDYSLYPLTDKICCIYNVTSGKVALMDYTGKLLTGFDYSNSIYPSVESGYILLTKTETTTIDSVEHEITTYVRVNEKTLEETVFAKKDENTNTSEVKYHVGETEVYYFLVTDSFGYMVTVKGEDSKYTVTYYNNAGEELVKKAGIENINEFNSNFEYEILYQPFYNNEAVIFIEFGNEIYTATMKIA